MNFAAWYAILVGLLVFGQQGFFLAMGQVPELQSELLRICFHLAGEFITAAGLLLAGIAVLKRWAWAASLYLVAAGMLLYSVIVSPGHLAQQGQWAFAGMFALLFALALVSIVWVARSKRS
ncbi:MAG: hypothetical protein H5T69_16010 [Chloroflexi bacterium]|nr:hypothetical protein [Chloroflexota bacterium]